MTETHRQDPLVHAADPPSGAERRLLAGRPGARAQKIDLAPSPNFATCILISTEFARQNLFAAIVRFEDRYHLGFFHSAT
jgi:hypothetical protein